MTSNKKKKKDPIAIDEKTREQTYWAKYDEFIDKFTAFYGSSHRSDEQYLVFNPAVLPLLEGILHKEVLSLKVSICRAYTETYTGTLEQNFGHMQILDDVLGMQEDFSAISNIMNVLKKNMNEPETWPISTKEDLLPFFIPFSKGKYHLFIVQKRILEYISNYTCLHTITQMLELPTSSFNWSSRFGQVFGGSQYEEEMLSDHLKKKVTASKIAEVQDFLKRSEKWLNALIGLKPTVEEELFQPSFQELIKQVNATIPSSETCDLLVVIDRIVKIKSLTYPTLNEATSLTEIGKNLTESKDYYLRALFQKYARMKSYPNSALNDFSRNIIKQTVKGTKESYLRELKVDSLDKELKITKNVLNASRVRNQELQETIETLTAEKESLLNQLTTEITRVEDQERIRQNLRQRAEEANNLVVSQQIALSQQQRILASQQAEIDAGQFEVNVPLLEEVQTLQSTLTFQQLRTGLLLTTIPGLLGRAIVASQVAQLQEVAAQAPVAGGPDVFAPDRVIRAVEALNAAAIDLPSRPTLSASLGHHLPIGSFGRLALNVGVEVKPGVTSPRISLTLKTKIEPYMRDLHAKNQGFHLEFEGKNVYKNTGITLERGWNFNKTSYTFFEILSPMSSGSPLQIGAGFYLEEERSIVPSLLSNLPSPYLVIQGYLPIKRNVVNIPIRLFFNRMTLDSKSISNGVADETIVEEMPEIAVPALSDLDLDTDLDTEVVVSPETELSSIVKKAHYLQDLILASNLSIALGKTIPLGCALAVIIRLQKNAPTKSVTLRAAHIAILALDTRSFIALLVFIKTHILLNQIFKKGYFYKTPIVAYGFRRVDTLSIYIAKKGTSIPLVVRKTVLVALNLISLYRLLSFILSKSSVSTKALQIVGLGLYLLTSQKACEWLIKDEEDDIKGKIDK